jgi:hypothetical protein
MYVHIYGHMFVERPDDVVAAVEDAIGYRAIPDRYDYLRLRYLFVYPKEWILGLPRYRTSDEHDVGVPWRTLFHYPKALYIIAWRERSDHLDVASVARAGVVV